MGEVPGENKRGRWRRNLQEGVQGRVWGRVLAGAQDEGRGWDTSAGSGYLQEGAGLAVNLYFEALQAMGKAESPKMPKDSAVDT